MSLRSPILASRSARTWFRLQAATLVLLFVTSHVASLVHATTELPVRCAEHGELIHLDVADAATLRQADGHKAHDALWAGTAPVPEHAHEHCQTCSQLRAPALDSRQHSTSIAFDVPAASNAFAFETSRIAAVPYQIAPKTSPPTPPHA